MIRYPLLWDDDTIKELKSDKFHFKSASFYDWCILYKSLNSPIKEIKKFQKYLQDNFPLVLYEKNQLVTSMWYLPVENLNEEEAIDRCNMVTEGLNLLYYHAMSKKTYNKMRVDLGLQPIKNFQPSRKLADETGTRQAHWERIVTLWSYRLDGERYKNALNEIDG